MMRALALAVASLLLVAPAAANDSAAALGIGGLIFETNDAVSMESEELYLSDEQVRVRYTYRNTSDKSVELLVAFPLPAVPLPGADRDWIEASYRDWNLFRMETLVEGKPVPLTRIDIPRVAGRDISERLNALDWPVVHWTSLELTDWLAKLSADNKSAFIAEGLLTNEGMGENQVRPAWSVETSFVRMQTFAPDKTVTVQHSYTPELGGTATTMLDSPDRAKAINDVDGDLARFCIEQDFLTAYDRKRNLPNGQSNENLMTVESWLSYVLKTGANWKGPIKRFHLIVEKKYPDTLVSLCMPGIKRTAPNRFEVVKTDFEPDRDIDILFARTFPMEGPN